MMKTSKLTRVLVAALVVCMLVCAMLPMGAMAAGTDAVNNAKNGVLQVNLVYTDDNNSPQELASGTGFLINDNTVVTCEHVIRYSDEDLAVFGEILGKSVAEMKSRLSITVTVARDVKIPATVITESYEMDFAVLRLSQSLQGKTPLAIRPSGDVKQAENVYAVGYPGINTALQAYSTYTSADASVTQGSVTKVALGENILSGANTEYIQTTIPLDGGNSGGPMVDENGYVVGICQGAWWLNSDDAAVVTYNHGIAIDQVTEVLDILGIVYEKATTAPPAPVVTEPPVVATEAPVAPTQAPVLPTLPPVEPTTIGSTAGEGPNMTMILIIAAVVVVIIIVVVVIVIAGGKKKQPAPVANRVPPQMPPQPPVRPNNMPNNAPGGFAPPPTFPVGDAGETTVLGGGAGETTVLSRASVNGGTLTRKRTGETVSINSDQFVIGRERKGVNYCISDNSSISRNHVRLTIRNGVTYLTDLGAANGTFVNGVKVMPRQEVALKNGDKITLADEDLEFKH